MTKSKTKTTGAAGRLGIAKPAAADTPDAAPGKARATFYIDAGVYDDLQLAVTQLKAQARAAGRRSPSMSQLVESGIRRELAARAGK